MVFRGIRFAFARVADGFFIDGYVVSDLDRAPTDRPQRNASNAVKVAILMELLCR
jgi:hypothetical protein